MELNYPIYKLYSMEQIYLELDVRTELGWIKTFYLFDNKSLDIFANWYEQLESQILDSGLEISQSNLQYSTIESTDAKFDLVDKFVKEFGKPFDLLEQIEELEQIVNKELYSNSETNSDTDSDLYTQTETIGDIISAHISGDTNRVIQLLGSSNASGLDDDEIISNIKKKYL